MGFFLFQVEKGKKIIAIVGLFIELICLVAGYEGVGKSLLYSAFRLVAISYASLDDLSFDSRKSIAAQRARERAPSPDYSAAVNRYDRMLRRVR